VTSSYTVDVLDRSGLYQLSAAQWDELSANAIDENPFYARAYVIAGLQTIDANADLRAVTVREQGALVGLFLFRLKRWPVERAVAASNVYQFNTQPLIHRDHARAVVAAWQDALQKRQIPRRWSFPDICLSSAFIRECQSLGATSQLDLIPSAAYARARLTRLDGGFDAHLQTVVSKSRAKDIQRSIRRLRELGEVTFERQRDSAMVAQRIEDFLAIEHAGWKGRAGTSILANDAHAAFARQAFRQDGAARTSVDSLLLDGKPLAISVNLQTGDTVFTPKCAYDENFRKFSPGLVLEYLVIEAFYRDGECAEMDSSTTVDNHVIQGLWNCDRAIAQVLIGPQGWRTRLLASAQQRWAEARHRFKTRIGGDRVLEIRAALRRWKHKARLIQSNALVGSAGFLHAVEALAPVI
jgi:CelD/BcsL family acetyltransferase involved in cellulose biosynthesis